MEKLAKLDLISIIGRTLQERMTFTDIDGYFREYQISIPENPNTNSKWTYVKDVLAGVDNEIIFEMASELEIEHPEVSEIPIVKDEEATFWKPGHFRLFMSHLSVHKETVGRLKISLEKYGISSFVAHEDIEPTKLWEKEIEKGLFSMNALCAILMPGFKKSNWTDQEVGVAIGRGVLVIPIRKKIDPYGFIGKFQGFQANNKTIGEVAKGTFKILSTHEKTRSKLINKLVDLFLMSNNAEEAYYRLEALKLIKDLPEDKVEKLREEIFKNKNLDQSQLLKSFNELMIKFNKPMVDFKEFKTKKEEDWSDDLPF
ncbi:MAG: toll/interleukin-1 receptor domain-containing protein [Candidatus Paceibacterota bacterium]